MAMSPCPGVKDVNAGRDKVGDVPRHNSHTMHERRGSDKAITQRLRIWDMQLRASLCDGNINRQDASSECR